MEIAMNKHSNADIISAVKDIKNAILTSRYNAARLANREQLTLYFNIGEYISAHSRTAKWGTGAIASISELLQKELPGLRGFSESGIKRMRTFYEGWYKYTSAHPTSPDDFSAVTDLPVISKRLCRN